MAPSTPDTPKAFFQSIRQVLHPPAGGICLFCGRVVEDLARHECATESPEEYFRELAGMEQEKYKRAKSYTVE